MRYYKNTVIIPKEEIKFFQVSEKYPIIKVSKKELETLKKQTKLPLKPITFYKTKKCQVALIEDANEYAYRIFYIENNKFEVGYLQKKYIDKGIIKAPFYTKANIAQLLDGIPLKEIVNKTNSKIQDNIWIKSYEDREKSFEKEFKNILIQLKNNAKTKLPKVKSILDISPKSIKEANNVILDLETTGIDAQTEKIIEIGLVFFNNKGEILEMGDSLINPNKPLSQTISFITSITNDMLKNEKPFDIYAEKLKTLLEGKIVFAYNVNFDKAFLEEEFKRLKIPFPSIKTKDVLMLTENKLEIASRDWKCENPSTHRAIDDCIATLQLMKQIAASPDLGKSYREKVRKEKEELKKWKEHVLKTTDKRPFICINTRELLPPVRNLITKNFVYNNSRWIFGKEPSLFKQTIKEINEKHKEITKSETDLIDQGFDLSF